MANEAHVKQLLELGEECMTAKTMIDQIISPAEWVTINFAAGRATLENIFHILDQFKRLPIGLLPDNIIEQMIVTLQPLKMSLDQMRKFSPEQENHVAARDLLVAQYRRQAERFLGAALLYNCLSCLLAGRRSDKYNCLSCILDQ